MRPEGSTDAAYITSDVGVHLLDTADRNVDESRLDVAVEDVATGDGYGKRKAPGSRAPRELTVDASGR